MSRQKSQTVRLHPEILTALSKYVGEKGGTQQQVVSVGAWFYMCMPANLRDVMNQAFARWCDTASASASIPADAPAFVHRVIEAIEEECAKEQSRFVVASDATPDAAAEQAVDEAVRDRRNARKHQGKGRRIG